MLAHTPAGPTVDRISAVSMFSSLPTTVNTDPTVQQCCIRVVCFCYVDSADLLMTSHNQKMWCHVSLQLSLTHYFVDCFLLGILLSWTVIWPIWKCLEKASF